MTDVDPSVAAAIGGPPLAVVALKGSKKARSFEVGPSAIRIDTARTVEPYVVPRAAIAGFAYPGRRGTSADREDMLVRDEAIAALTRGDAYAGNLAIVFATSVIGPRLKVARRRRRAAEPPADLVDAVLVSSQDPAEAGRQLLAAGLPALGDLRSALAATIGSVPLATLPAFAVALRRRVRLYTRMLAGLWVVNIVVLGAARILTATSRERLVIPLIALTAMLVASSYGLMAVVRRLRRRLVDLAAQAAGAAGRPGAPGHPPGGPAARTDR